MMFFFFLKRIKQPIASLFMTDFLSTKVNGSWATGWILTWECALMVQAMTLKSWIFW